MGNLGIVSSARNVSIVGNVIADNDDIGIVVNSLASGRIAYNAITGHGSDAIGAYLAPNAEPTLIEHNRLCDNLGRGLGVNGSVDIMTVRNNTLSRSSSNAVELYPSSTGTLRVDRNIFFRNDFFAFAIQAGNITGDDNVFFENGSGSGEFSRPAPDTSIEGTDPGFQSSEGCELRLPLRPALTTEAGQIIGAR